MKAIVCHGYGSPDVLKLEEVQKPIPKDNEVLIKVLATSVNSYDDVVKDPPFMTRLLFGLLKPRTKIFGVDVAGRVEAVGRSVGEFQPGDEVFGDVSGCGFGGFAEYVCARANVLAPKSPKLTFEEAAAMPQAGVLALQGLRYKGQIGSGEKVLLNGAAGGVGTFAMQMAKSSGAEVTGVDSTMKLNMMRSMGFDHVIDYTRENFTENGQGYDLILDVVGLRSVFEYKRSLNPKGVYVMIGGPWARIFQVAFLGPWISKTTSKRMGILLHKPNRNDLIILNEFCETGKVKPVIDGCYPLSEVPEVVRRLGSGLVKGKAVITVN